MEQELSTLKGTIVSMTGILPGVTAVLGRMVEAAATLKEAGMYEHQPGRERWENRNGDGAYLYLYWGRDGSQHKGPEGKRKVYIGNDPERIADARRLIKNGERYRRLKREEQTAVSCISRALYQIRQAVRELTSLQRGVKEIALTCLDDFIPASARLEAAQKEVEYQREQMASGLPKTR
jgi:hypothetical protein